MKYSAGQFCDIEFRNISYSANLGWRSDGKRILCGLNGKISRGKFVAILGPSGSGKTSLLNILSGYETYQISGELLLNGNCTDFKKISTISTYISQETHLQPLLTVEEYMQIAAEFKLCGEAEDVTKKVDKVLRILGLLNEKDVSVAKLSGGQRKRLSIALELVGDPEVMFLDEPTTGLDSYSTQHCIKYLKYLTEQGMTIICTLHQPAASIFYLFDDVYVLKEGNCMYRGLTSELIPFLEEAGAACPISYNLADYVVELANGDYGEEIANKLIVMAMGAKYHSGNISEKINLDISTRRKMPNDWHQISILLRREGLKASRNPTLTYLRLVTSVTNSLVLSTVFWKVGSNGATVWFNYNAIMGFILHLMMPSLMLTILTFPSETLILQREYFNRWYSLKNYYAAITIADLPISITYCIVSNVIIYTLTDQPLEWFRFAMFTSLGLLVCVVAQSLGLLVGAMFNVVNGTFIGSAISFPMLAFGGFGVTYKDLPPYLKWFSDISYLRYASEGMTGAVNGYNRTKLPCPSDDYCHYSYSQRFMDDLGIQGDRFWTDVIILTSMFLVLRIVTYFTLKIKVRIVR